LKDLTLPLILASLGVKGRYPDFKKPKRSTIRRTVKKI